jgi:hypothetical protein
MLAVTCIMLAKVTYSLISYLPIRDAAITRMHRNLRKLPKNATVGAQTVISSHYVFYHLRRCKRALSVVTLLVLENHYGH